MEKRIAELRAEFQLMNLELRQQVEAELRKYLGAPEMKAAGATPQHVTTPDQECTVARDLEEEEHYNSERGEDREQILDQILSPFPSETPNCSDDGFDSNKLRDREISPLSVEDHSTSHQTECGPINNQTSLSDAPSVSESSQLMKQSEEQESAENPLHVSEVSEQKSGQKITDVDDKKIDEALLMEDQWTKWLDELEGRINRGNRKPQGKKKTEKQENTEKHARAEGPKKKSGHTNTMMKIRARVSHFFHPCTSYKWEKLD